MIKKEDKRRSASHKVRRKLKIRTKKHKKRSKTQKVPRKKVDDDITIHAKSFKGKILIYSISGGKAEIVKFNEEIVWGEISEGDMQQVCTILNFCFAKEAKQNW